MKIVSLNTWGGRAGREVLLSFFKKYADQIDIFCLQEVWAGPHEDIANTTVGGRVIDMSKIVTDMLQSIEVLLPDHECFFRPHFRNHYGLATFVRKGIPVISEGEYFVYQDKEYVTPPGVDIGMHARNVQFVTIETSDGPLTVMNFHGLWNGKGKYDCDERIVQSARIIQFLETLTTPVILMGDFNLTPETTSLKMLEDYGLTNLIALHNITSTRTSLYDKMGGFFADYALVSKEIEVVDFKVLPDVVSDHAPLYLEIRPWGA